MSFGLCHHCLQMQFDGGLCRRCAYDGMPRNEHPELPEGTQIGNRFILGKSEGRGGFSICYRGFDLVARKVEPAKELFPADVARRGRRGGVVEFDRQHGSEMQEALNCLRHEATELRALAGDVGILRVEDLIFDNNTAYMSAEFLRGQDLWIYLEHEYARTGQEMDVETACTTARHLLGALHRVHRRGLLHLDIKPTNIRVTDDGRVVLMDFGSSRYVFKADGGLSANTFTPGFAAPEQHLGGEDNGPATDVYGMGATLYYCLSRKTPVAADQRLRGASLDRLQSLNPQVPAALETVIAKAMALEIGERFASADEFRIALRPFSLPSKQIVTSYIPRGRPPTVRPAPMAPLLVRRCVAGVVDTATALLIVALATGGYGGDMLDHVPHLLFAWFVTQAPLLIFDRTLGLALTGLRLEGAEGGRPDAISILKRTMLLLAGLFLARDPAATQTVRLHDSLSSTRVRAVR